MAVTLSGQTSLRPIQMLLLQTIPRALEATEVSKKSKVGSAKTEDNRFKKSSLRIVKS